MARNLLQDMVRIKSATSSSIGNTALKPEAKKEEIFKEIYKPKVTDEGYVDYEASSSKDGTSNILMWIVAVTSFVFLLFTVSAFFARATVNLYPKMVDFDVDVDTFAIKNSTTDLSYSLLKDSGEEIGAVPKGAEVYVSEKAKGKVIIYNNFGVNSQNLAIDTRLEGSNGKIYKTEKAITVPGIDEDGNPGSVEVGIYASETGEEYNSEPLDFTIVGFKGSTKYSKFYARSVGPVEGGFEGNQSAVSDDEIASMRESLENKLHEKLLGKLKASMPIGFVLLDGGSYLGNVETSVDLTSDKDSAFVSVGADFYSFMFKEKDLTDKLAELRLADYEEGDDLYIPDIDKFKFTLISPRSEVEDLSKIDFNIAGSSKFVYKVNPDDVMAKVLGISKKDFEMVLQELTSVGSAHLSIKPFWRTKLPDKINKIKIIVNYPE